MVVRNISIATHLALKKRAAANGRSLNAEVLAIINEALRFEIELERGQCTQVAEKMLNPV
jgi:plasmid stability protein